MSSKPPHPHPDKLTLYEKVIDTLPSIERKGAANPYTSLNGHMFSFLDKEGKVSLRLPKDALEKFLKQHRTKLSIQYNTVMKEYALVPVKLLKDTKALKKYFEVSIAYIESLKPKPTSKKKK